MLNAKERHDRVVSSQLTALYSENPWF